MRKMYNLLLLLLVLPFIFADTSLDFLSDDNNGNHNNKGEMINITPMEREEIVPDVIDNVPNGVVNVTFGFYRVNMGNVLKTTEVREIPSEVVWGSNSDKFYTLILTDPDAPSRANPIYREWQHWIVVNIPGLNISGGQTLTEFCPSNPGRDTGFHRYTILVYEQLGLLEFNEPVLTDCSVEPRRSFSARGLSNKYNLGQPIAGNFYLTQAEALH